MAIVCSGCDEVPPAAATPGAKCLACGELLVTVADVENLSGSVIDGRFEVIAPLGKGGMGVVYRGKQLSIGREVAIKVLDRRIEHDVASVKRFFREAKLASTLAHPNTVPIIDFGQSADGRLYLVMELVTGRTLLDEINRTGPLPPARIADIGGQLCDALEAAHDQSIVHRDLKLENVMLAAGKRDHVKILDFGLARSLTDPTSQMTATGLISGTPRYMPPEVALHAVAPAASQDMYALGVILGELAVGRALWSAPTLEALIVKKLDTEASIAGVPEPIRGVVRALLAEDPEQRPTAAAARKLLREVDTRATALAGVHAQVATAPTANIAVKDPFANAKVVMLDGQASAPRAALTEGPIVIEPAEETKLELDPQDMASRAAKRAGQHEVELAKPKRKPIAGRLAALVVVLAAGAASAYYLTRDKPVHNSNNANKHARVGGGIELEITADPPTAITIDGKPAGTTPLTFKLAKPSKSAVLIEGDGVTPIQVIPDHDQTIRLVRTE